MTMMCSWRRWGLCLLIVIFGYSSLWLAPLHASSDKETQTSKRLVVLSIPGLSFLELENSLLNSLPTLRYITQHGGVGALNVRTPERGLEDAYLSIGAGAPAIARYDVPALHDDERWQGELGISLYRRYSPMEDVQSMNDVAERILVPEIAKLYAYNETSMYRSKVGLLGDLLDEQGVDIYVFGNSDFRQSTSENTAFIVRQRHAALMAMNAEGTVPKGEIGDDVVVQLPQEPQGLVMDHELILRRVQEVAGPAFILIEYGDLYRLFSEKDRYAAKDFEQKKLQVLRRIDELSAAILQFMGDEDELLLFSPMVNEQASARKLRLAPILHFEATSAESLIQSSTTRQLGLATLHDIAPYILHQFGVEKPQDMSGSTLIWQPKEEAFIFLEQQLAHMRAVYDARPNLLYSFVSYEVIVLLATLVFALFRWRLRKRIRVIWHGLLLSILTAPAAMLIVAYVPMEPWQIGLSLCIVWIGMTIGLSQRTTWSSLFLAASLNVAIIVVDGLLGAPGMKRSILGYDPMIGARYYGIGNEFMGVLIGASVLATSIYLHWLDMKNKVGKSSKIAVALLFGFLFIYLAAPELGTNAGGAISAAAAFLFACFRWFVWEKEGVVPWVRLGLFVPFAAIISIVLLGGLHWLAPWIGSESSHIGRAFSMLFEGRFDVIGSIITRKLAMNWHLIGVSAWSKVLLVSLLVMVFCVLRPSGVLRSWQQQYPYVMNGFSANAVGVIVTLLVNDSGIVAAATLIVFVAAPMLILHLINYSDNRDSHSSYKA